MGDCGSGDLRNCGEQIVEARLSLGQDFLELA